MSGDATSLRVLHLQIDMRDGGGQRLVLDLAQRMRPQGVESSTAYFLADHTMTEMYERAAIAYHFVDHRPKRIARSVYRLVRLLRDGRFDVVHTHSELDKWVGYVAARLARIPLVTHIHGSTPWLLEPGARTGWPPTPRNLKRRAVLRLSYGPYVSSAIAVSEAVKREHEPVARCPIEVIYNGIDIGRFRRKDLAVLRPASRSELGVDGRRVVLFTGRLEPAKRPDVLVAAAADLMTTHGDVVVLMAGDGSMRSTIEQQVIELGLGERLRVLGRVEDVAPLLAAADLFVLPSRSEGFGLALAEAMVAGVPVIASRLPAIEEVVHDQVTGTLVPAEDPTSLANAMRRAFDDRSTTSAMTDRAERDATARFDIERTALQIASIYRTTSGRVERSRHVEA